LFNELIRIAHRNASKYLSGLANSSPISFEPAKAQAHFYGSLLLADIIEKVGCGFHGRKARA